MLASVVWQSKSPVVLECFRQKKITSIIKGGNVYNFQAAMALTQQFDVSIDENAVKYDDQSMLKYLLRHHFNTPDADITVKENYPVVVGTINRKSKNAALIHHIDEVNTGQTWGHKIFFNRLFSNLRKMDLVITVSEYWKNYLLQMGCKQVEVIYNSFIPEDYIVSIDEVERFKKKYQFSGKPIVYIGNAHKQKGVYEAYQALKNMDVELVMTEAVNMAPDLPVKFLSLSHREFITLLHASEVVVLMSKLLEGWNRVAHEALLCKTPVIGSGSGGMSELLTKSNQIISTPETLKSDVINVLHNRNAYCQSGYDYVKQYNMEYFNSSWISTITKLLNN
jgi:glycosyltransferase involved in cell wall biosynthesis